MDEIYYPLSLRLKIPGSTLVTVPYRLEIVPQVDMLERVEIFIPQAGVLQDLGVRITSKETQLYPAMGSLADTNFSGKDMFGVMPTSGLDLCIPFNRQIQGPPYSVVFEFYNDAVGTVSVNILLVTYKRRILPKADAPVLEVEKKV